MAFYSYPMAFCSHARPSRGHPMAIPWLSHGYPMVFNGYPMAFDGYPMAFASSTPADS